MSSFKKAERVNIFALEESVINDPPEEVARVYKELGEVPFTARALGLACRFRDLETVKALVEGGAKFKYDELAFRGSYQYFFIEYFHGYYPEFQNFLIKEIGLACEYTVAFFVEKLKNKDGGNLKISPDSERVKIMEYLCGNAEKIGFEPGEMLYYMIVTDDKEMISVLKQNGIALSGNKRKMLTEKGGALIRIPKSDNELMKIISALRSEVSGEKLHITSSMQYSVEKRFSNPELFRFFLENFDQSNIRKGSLLEGFVLSENIPCLEIAIQLGWLKMPKKRDELIEYSQKNGKTECTAWLLDFKNRTADLAKERKRAEKKQERELNAAPDSVTALKPLWSWKKRGDGTLIITGYKGNLTEITVPSKIGKDTVTAIGEYAFSPNAKRICEEQRSIRENITKVTLPDTVTELGEFVFFKCKMLSEVVLPKNLSEISKGMFDITNISSIVIGGNIKKLGAMAFYGCNKLKTVVLCEGVREIGNSAFYNCGALETVEIPRSVESIAFCENVNPFTECHNLTVVVHKGSYAENYCKENKIPFVYKE